MSMEDILQRLAEDRVLAERERRQYRIAEAFELARKADLPIPKAATPSTTTPKPRTDRILEQTPPTPKPLRPLHEIAEVYVRVAGRQVSGTPVLHPHHEGAYFVQPPCESASVLMEQALIAIQQIPTTKAEERHLVEDE